MTAYIAIGTTLRCKSSSQIRLNGLNACLYCVIVMVSVFIVTNLSLLVEAMDYAI